MDNVRCTQLKSFGKFLGQRTFSPRRDIKKKKLSGAETQQHIQQIQHASFPTGRDQKHATPAVPPE